ncbi:MAG: hypothetical protein RQ745_01500 [Longimicrobiales bacterium]|nr:hypothetical protein [Longimicrobiales bacterium]
MTRSLAVLLVLMLAPVGVEAQSVLGIGRFGFPLSSVDARGRALGGVGVGLGGAILSATDPAAAADINAVSFIFSGGTSFVDVSRGDDVSSDFTTTRFPLVGASYFIEKVGVISFTFSSLVDQEWEDQASSVIDVEGGGEIFVTDIFQSDGSVGALEIGLARRFGGIAVGARVGRYVGDLRRDLTRVVDSVSVGSGFAPFETSAVWEYSGFTGIVGASTVIDEQVHLAASVRFGGDLDADPVEDTEARPVTISLPTELRLGGSVLLAPSLFANLGFETADWSDTDPDGQRAWSIGGGIEWTGSRILGKDGAWRIGARRERLAIKPAGAASASERTLSAGLAIVLARSSAGALGSVDFAFELGDRSAGDLSEDILRSTVTLRVAGF